MKKTATQTEKKNDKTARNAFNAITAICGIVISGSSMEESLGRIASITSETLNAKACSLMLYDSEKHEFSIKASQGLNPVSGPGMRINSDNTTFKNAIIEKKIVTSPGTEGYGNPILPGTSEFGNYMSMISAPIMYNGETLGVINSYSLKNHDFSADEKKTIQAIADQAAAVIQLVKYRDEACRAKEALKDRKIIEKAKGILMKQQYITEAKAYSIIRSKSMDTGRPIKEIAEAIVMTDEIKSQHHKKG